MIAAVLILTAFLWGLACAFVGVVYAVVLAENDTPLNKWFDLLRWAQDRGGWTSWIASPLGGCQNCFSGQLALWSFSIVLPWSSNPISIAAHLFAACSAVIFAHAITALYRWIKNLM